MDSWEAPRCHIGVVQYNLETPPPHNADAANDPIDPAYGYEKTQCIPAVITSRRRRCGRGLVDRVALLSIPSVQVCRKQARRGAANGMDVG